MSKKQFTYYDYHDLLSRNGTFNFLVSNRGNGKTYGAKQLVIKDYLRNGHQFIYLRRYKTELSERASWFADIAHEFPDMKFRIHGNIAQCQPAEAHKDEPWNDMGYFVSLSNVQAKKSVPYPLVRTIIFDEFILERGALHYLPNEADVFNGFYSTVDRWQDKTRVFFLANTVSIMNPYFLKYDIRPQDNKEWVRDKTGFVVCHFPNSEEFKGEVYQTKFGKFIRDSEYANYAIEGSFRDNNDAMINLKGSEYSYLTSVETFQGTFSVWLNPELTHCHISDKHPRKPNYWTMEPSLMDEHKTLVPYNNKILQMLRAMFGHGNATFNSPQARNMFIQIWKR